MAWLYGDVGCSCVSRVWSQGRWQNPERFISCGSWGPAPWGKSWVRGCDTAEGRDNGIQGLWGTTWQCPGSIVQLRRCFCVPRGAAKVHWSFWLQEQPSPASHWLTTAVSFSAVKHEGLVDPSSAGLCWSWPTGFQEHSQSWAEQEWLASPRVLSDDWI